MTNDLHNEMAEFAFGQVKKIHSAKKAEFRSLARSFPSMVQANGLCASIAFLYAKQDSASQKAMYDLINTWFAEHCDCSSNTKLAERIISLNSKEYRLYTTEVMNLCLWVKRFAEGMAEDDGKQQTRE